MIIYSAYVLGEKFSLVPTASPDGGIVNYLKSRGEAFALVLPSLKYDLFVEGFSQEGKPFLNNIASAYAAAAFLSGVRGIPFEDLSVGSPEGEYRAVKLEGYGVSIELSLKTVLSQGLSLSLLGADTQYRVSSCKYGRVALVEARDIQCFETEALPLVTSGHNHFCACGAPSRADNTSGSEYPFCKQPVCGALVYSRDGGEVRAKAYFPRDGLDFRLAALGGLSAITLGAPRATLDCNGVRYTLMRCGGRLLLSFSVEFSGKKIL